MIVADTNLIVYLVVPGPYTAAAERVRAKDKIWSAPQLLPHELLNVLATHIRHGGMDRDSAVRTYRRALSLVRLTPNDLDPAGPVDGTGQRLHNVRR